MKPALEIVEKWGFKEKTIITWIKTGLGMGYYYRVCTEHIIFATKGKGRLKTRNTKNYFYAKTTGHSIKPIESYEMIEKNSNKPMLELFAQKKRADWDFWGDEVKSDININDYNLSYLT